MSEEIITAIVGNFPNFMGLLLLAFVQDRNYRSLLARHDKLIDFLIASRGLKPEEARSLLNGKK